LLAYSLYYFVKSEKEKEEINTEGREERREERTSEGRNSDSAFTTEQQHFTVNPLMQYTIVLLVNVCLT